MLTSFGKYLRKLRIDKGEILRDMAKRLSVSSAFLSAVENGKKKIPDSWFSKLGELYSLSSAQILELQEAILESRNTIELDISNVPPENRRLAVSFARQFNTLDEDASQKLFNILNNRSED